MADKKVKIQFLVDHPGVGEKEKSFMKGEVVALNIASAHHFTRRMLAQEVPASTKVGRRKIEKQESLLDDDLALRDIPELAKIANDKYPDVVVPDVFEREQLIAFIGNGDASVFGVVVEDDNSKKSIGSTISDWFKKAKPDSEVDLSTLEVSELLEIAKEAYPDVVIPDEPGKEDLITFIGSGDLSAFVVGDAS